MKRAFYLLILILLCFPVIANDIIIKTDETKLEVVITAVSREQITYRMPDMQDGPDFILSTNEIATIIFRNGQVKVYDHTTNEEPKSSTIVQQTPEVNHKPALANQEIYNPAEHYAIVKDRDGYWYNNNPIKKDQVEQILNRFDPEATKIWNKGDAMLIGGAVSSGVGLGLALGGLAFLPLSSEATTAITCTGLPFCITGVVLAVVGSKRHEQAISVYNHKLNTTFYFDLKASTSGVGFALHF